MTTMRKYVDAMRGPGSWDRMHGLIEGMSLGGWDLVPVSVDGHLVHIFPGSNPEVTLEEIQQQIRNVLPSLNSQPACGHTDIQPTKPEVGDG